jgi:hypothetical protein
MERKFNFVPPYDVKYDYKNDYTTHRRFLKFYVEKTLGSIIELGTGYASTPYLHYVSCTENRLLISLEDNPNWLKAVLSIAPNNRFHEYQLVADWSLLFLRYSLEKNISIAFVDQEPWIARRDSVLHYKDIADYVIIHDADHFIKMGFFGKFTEEGDMDFSDIFKKWKVYYEETGPPTLVGSNKEHTEIYDI